MRPPRADIAAPELPARVRWLNGKPAPMATLLEAGPVLVHFFDFAQLNSVRALPYLRAWNQRYAAGLMVLGVHSPRFPFTATRKALKGGLERLGLTHPVAQDSSYAIWQDYGCRGWPSLFLWSRDGALAYFHFGEGAYREIEEAIQEQLREGDALTELPEPLDPIRSSDAPGAGVLRPTPEVFPGGDPREPWRRESSDERLVLSYGGAGAYASATGAGDLQVLLDGEALAVAIDGPGLYPLAEHPRHEEHSLVILADEGVELYAVSFAAGVP